jgi:hypothetical protein
MPTAFSELLVALATTLGEHPTLLYFFISFVLVSLEFIHGLPNFSYPFLVFLPIHLYSEVFSCHYLQIKYYNMESK